MKQGPLLSIVVTSYTVQRLKDIYELLDSIRNQSYRNIEVIFVAERSRELYEKIKNYGEEKGIPPNMVSVFNDGEPGLSIARNLGIKYASGDIIGFVDDDAVLFSDWAEEVVKALENNSAIGVTGPAFPLWEDESMSWLPDEFYWLVSCTAWTGWKETRVVRSAFGANMAFKGEAFANDCLFSPNAGYAHASHHQSVSDDLEFSLRVRKRMGKPIIFSPGPRIWHRVYKKRLGWRFITARSHQIGCTRRIIRRYYADELGPYEQERQVLKGVLRLLLGIPKESINRPIVAWKKLSLTFIVLISIAIGYLVPLPRYSTIKQKWDAN
jgi:glycosyltransferase involved in cell wall biosynthesis